MIAAIMFPLKGMAASDGRLTQVGTMVAVDFAALVSKADLDFKVPLGGLETERGLPIGNGRVGTLLWTHPEQSKLHMQVNHTDVFAFRSSSPKYQPRRGAAVAAGGNFPPFPAARASR
ncbi:MAG: hypothetical protein NTW21_44765 [Verrucomicrobia bacterium]|nr:hypothetical protein [Verrucomicrobiota bacterium]